MEKLYHTKFLVHAASFGIYYVFRIVNNLRNNQIIDKNKIITYYIFATKNIILFIRYEPACLYSIDLDTF